MTPPPSLGLGALSRRAALRCSLTLCALVYGSILAAAQAQPAAAPAPRQASAAKPGEGPAWHSLTPSQREALQPLERDWSGIDANRKQKWLEIAKQYPRLPSPEQSRMQTRMAEWAQLTPQERGQVRQQYQEAKRVAPQDRQASWEAYQALPADQRRQFTARAAPAASEPLRRAPPERSVRSDKTARDPLLAKSNIVPNPSLAAPPKPVAPTVVQAQPGATTMLMSKRSAPPAHQQAGMPKIAATPGFVDKATLLPQRGAQGAATRSAAASAPTPRP